MKPYFLLRATAFVLLVFGVVGLLIAALLFIAGLLQLLFGTGGTNVGGIPLDPKSSLALSRYIGFSAILSSVGIGIISIILIAISQLIQIIFAIYQRQAVLLNYFQPPQVQNK